MENPSNNLKYAEQTFTSKPEARLDDIWGKFQQVTDEPRWTPKKFIDGFAIYSTGGTYRLYVYDFTSNSWRYAALT